MSRHGAIGIDRDRGRLYLVELAATREGPILKAAADLPEENGGMPRPLQESAFSARAAALSVPRSGAIHRLLDLPPLDAAETGMAARHAVEEQLPFPPEQLCLAFQRQGRGKRVRVTCARRPAVEDRLNLAKRAGLRPVRVDLRSAAAAAAFLFGRGSAAACAVLLELYREETAAVFIKEGEVQYSRAMPGLDPGAASNLPEIASALRASFALADTWPDWQDPDCLWLSGPLAADERTRTVLASALDIDPARLRIAKPLGLLRPAGLPEPGPEMLAPIGSALAALGLVRPGPNLLEGMETAGSRWTASIRRWAAPIGLTALFILGGLGLLLAAGDKKKDQRQAWVAAHASEAAALKRLADDSEKLRAKIAVLAKYGSSSGTYLEFLKALDETMPPGTRITRLSLAGARVEVIEGTTPSVSALMNRLKPHPALAGLNLSGQATRLVVDGRVCEAFTLTGAMAPGEGGE